MVISLHQLVIYFFVINKISDTIDADYGKLCRFCRPYFLANVYIYREEIMNNNNPFEFFQSFMNQENLAKSTKWIPTMDIASFGKMIKEAAETIASNNQLVSDSFQSIAKRGADSFQKNTSEMFSTMKEVVSAGDIEQITNCQQNYLKSTVENNINNTKEILDITSKSSIEVLDAIGKNFAEKMNKPFAKNKH